MEGGEGGGGLGHMYTASATLSVYAHTDSGVSKIVPRQDNLVGGVMY